MKKLLFSVLLIMVAIQAPAAHVDLPTAKSIASSFILNSPNGHRLAAQPGDVAKLLYVEPNSSRPEQAVYYIFNSSQGFVIVAGDDRAQQILAYGDRPLDIKRMPENMRFWLGTYKHQMEFLQANPSLVVEKPRINQRWTTPTVHPMLTALWDQAEPFFNHCPIVNGDTCLTGCPATSLSQVFYYWKYPVGPTPDVPSYINTYTGTSVPALPSTTFDWDNMLDEYIEGEYTDQQADAVAWLMRYVGQVEHMSYAPDGSGAQCSDILRAAKFFGYNEEADIVMKSLADGFGNEMQQIYTDEQWAEMLQTELYEGRPVVYCAYDYDSQRGWSGHAFNVDGYSEASNTYHVNWGWSGIGNGDFALNAFGYKSYTFNIEQQMILGLQPPITTPTIMATPYQLNMTSYVDQSNNDTFIVRGKCLIDDVTMTLTDESGSFSLDVSTVALADTDSGKVVTVTYSPLESGHHDAIITLSSPDAEDVTIALSGDAVLNVSTPVMLPADSAFISLTGFRADWTDETDAKYVESYTVEVNTTPGYTLIAEADWSDYGESSENYANYPEELLPEGWTFEGNGLWRENGGISVNNKSSLLTPVYDLSGYDKVTVVVMAKSAMTQSSSRFSVSTSVGEMTFSAPGGTDFTQYVAVIDCSEIDQVKISGKSSFPVFQSIQVYAGENEALTLRGAQEEGDASSRIVTGITGNSYEFTDLTPGGAFYYRVKAYYIDGTNSSWSKSQHVVLFGEAQEYQPGDVDHNGSIDIAGVTKLIQLVLTGSDNYPAASDVNADGSLSIADVTVLISMVLNNS